MSLSNTAQSAAEEISQMLVNHDLSAQEKAEVLRIVGASLAHAVEETSKKHNEVTRACCGAEADLAHKIADQIERNKKALVANLMALR